MDYDLMSLSRYIWGEDLQSKYSEIVSTEDNSIENRLIILENKVDSNTVYSDLELRGRIEVLENRPIVNSYDDSELKNRVLSLENQISSWVSGNKGSQGNYDEWIRCVYNVTDIDNPTKLFCETTKLIDGDSFSSNPTKTIGYLEIDGEKKDPCFKYTFSTLGLHYVNILLKNTAYLELCFSGLTNLKEITLPSSILFLNPGTFYGCRGINVITSLATIPPTLNDWGTNYNKCHFTDIRNNGVLRIPAEAVYQDGYWFNNLANEAKAPNLSRYGWTIEYIGE